MGMILGVHVMGMILGVIEHRAYTEEKTMNHVENNCQTSSLLQHITTPYFQRIKHPCSPY